MKVIDRAYVEAHQDEVLTAIKGGNIFIYPTDTIYGLGCNALDSVAVQKLREIKKREAKPFSVIAPSKEWIEEHCVVERKVIDKYLPGPYTLFVKRKDNAIAPEVNPLDSTLGVRIPKHWFTEFISKAGVPFVTTSVNISDKPHMARFEDITNEIADQVDYCIYEGEKLGTPSTKVDLVN